MKKLILTTILAVFFAIAGMSQYQQQAQQRYVPDPSTVLRSNVTMNQIQNGWTRVGTPCAGCASYWVQITRSQTQIQAEDGVYYYYFYFHFLSNSYYANGNPAATYLSTINFFNEGNFVFSTPYILLARGQTVWGAWMRLPDPNSTVTFTVANMNVQ